VKLRLAKIEPPSAEAREEPRLAELPREGAAAAAERVRRPGVPKARELPGRAA